MTLPSRPSPMLSRRTTRAAAVVAAATLFMTGCGADSGDAEGDAGKEPAASATRTVKDATGRAVKVPAEPKRIVTLTQEDLDAVLALGLKPVGITNGQGLDKPPAYLADRVEGIDIVGNLLQPVMDKVVAARPDLILAGDMQDEQVLDQLREITPATLVTTAPTDDWKLSLRGIGNAVNKLDAANEVITEHEGAAKAAGEKLGGNKGAEVSIVRWNPDGPSWMENKQFASGIALEMGLKRPKAQNKDGNAHTPSLSLEKINEIDGDWLFLSTLTSDGRKALQEVETKPAYKELKAVKGGRAVTVDGSVWSTRGGPLAAGVVMNDISEALGAS
ncbi:ABC transporter substrate-binding protein [Streptomyces sp. NPDC052042]|uniref:ABC transporter substrate-binding protein n=1 Tax=Streptomyces sp. NPDC052042 TaxID=3365683 RepID=UPI0037CDD20B